MSMFFRCLPAARETAHLRNVDDYSPHRNRSAMQKLVARMLLLSRPLGNALAIGERFDRLTIRARRGA
jgi:hypothetical protein